MKKTLLRLFQLLVILSLFFAVGCKKEKDEVQEEVGVKINGVIWATRNVDKPGTFAAKPEDAGMFYQWNRKVGWSSTDPMINSNGGATWDDSLPEGDSWEKANDPCPPGWRVPTHEEQRNIVNSGSKPAILNGVNGRYFGSGNQKLFFPASGLRYCSDGSLDVVGNFGHYWSSTLFQGDEYKFAHFMFLVWNEYADIHGVTHLNEGFSVRCVKEE